MDINVPMFKNIGLDLILLDYEQDRGISRGEGKGREKGR